MRYILVFLFVINFSFGQNKNTEKDSIIKEALNAYFKRDTVKLKKYTGAVFNLYQRTNDSTLLAKYHQYNALRAKITFKNDSAYYYQYQALEISKKLKDSLQVGLRYLSIAGLQRMNQDWIGSEENLIQCLKYHEPLASKDDPDIYMYVKSAYNILGLISFERKRYDESLKYYRKALELNEKVVNKGRKEKGYLYLINNIGVTYMNMNKYEKAIEYFKEGLAFENIKENYPSNYGLFLENFTESSFNLERYDDVLKNYNEVIDIRLKNGNMFDLSAVHINILDFYLKTGNLKKAKEYGLKALDYAKKSGNTRYILKSYYNLSKVTNEKESNNYLDAYIQLSDSLQVAERDTKNQFARISFETEKKEKENAILTAENQSKELEILEQKQQKTWGWFLAIFSLLGLGISILFFNLKKRKAAFIAELDKVRVANNERDRIAQELHDGILGRLFGTRFGLGFLPVGGGNEEAEKYGQLLDELQDIEKEIREVSHKLSYTPSSSSENFNAVINELIKEKSTIADLNYKVDIAKEINWDIIQKDIKTDIYRILQEALQNIIKHAKANTVSVAIKESDNNLSLEIEDNGVGFDVSEQAEGIGFRNMEARVKKLQGIFGVQSSKGNGTNVLVQIPI
ncbi:tetratricopeptide repeat protein [Tenacibaculum sp. 190524A05c]|uniref:tetratricopeptide repeat-containing sensor histidine kinase n=1 Tax=Tenacibaculum platacis TaxID=3137852 RepID=UPI0031FA6C6B